MLALHTHLPPACRVCAFFEDRSISESETRTKYTYDNNGNTLTDASGKSYTWDFENRLAQVVVPGSGTTAFRYDPIGRRIQKSGPLGTTNYFYDRASTVEEVDGSGNVVARYAQGKSVDEPLAQLRSGAASYYQQDELGSVTSLSNPTGGIAETYRYDSYGRPTASTGNLANPLQYTGREFDSETGLFYYRARYYDPSAGRFLSEDRLRLEQGPNFYRYVQNNPLRWIDPSGNGQTCWSVTSSGTMTEEPCANECLDNVCNVTPTGPPPPTIPPGDAWTSEDTELSNQMQRCLSEEIEEFDQLRTEEENSMLESLPWIPGKSLMIQGGEWGLESFEVLGAKAAELVGSAADGLIVIGDIADQVHKNNEFELKMKDVKQRECSCEQNKK